MKHQPHRTFVAAIINHFVVSFDLKTQYPDETITPPPNPSKIHAPPLFPCCNVPYRWRRRTYCRYIISRAAKVRNPDFGRAAIRFPPCLYFRSHATYKHILFKACYASAPKFPPTIRSISSICLGAVVRLT